MAENIALPWEVKLTRWGMTFPSTEDAVGKTQKERFDIRGRMDLPVGSMSGGNQQKVLLAKWLVENPKVFIVDEPTRGVDVGAKMAIYEIIRELAAAGMGVIVVSSELEEVLGLSHRVLVMSEGRQKGICAGLALGGFVGLINGLLSTYGRIQPFVATLATMSACSGIALYITNGGPVTGFPAYFSVLTKSRIAGIPVDLIILVTVFLIVAYWLRFRPTGRALYVIGGSEEVARLSGIDT